MGKNHFASVLFEITAMQ